MIAATVERAVLAQQAASLLSRELGMTHSPSGPSTIAKSMQHTMAPSAMPAA